MEKLDNIKIDTENQTLETKANTVVKLFQEFVALHGLQKEVIVAKKAKKSTEKRNYDDIIAKLQTSRTIKAINLEDKTCNIYSSMNQCSHDLGINPGTMAYCANAKAGEKSSISKKDNKRYSFEWTDEQVTKQVPRKKKNVV